MRNVKCYSCGKQKLTKYEIGLSKKLISMELDCFYCMDCIAEQLEVDLDFLLERIKQFKDEGCELF